MIVKSEDSKHSEFNGVIFEVLATEDSLIGSKINYKIGDKVFLYSHNG